MEEKQKEKLLTLSEFRREAGIPLVLAKKLVIQGRVKTVQAMDGSVRIARSEARVIGEIIKNPWTRARLFIKTLGPGLITGASDDDPGGIGTYSSVGAQFGFSILWMAAWLLPLMLAIQEVCARIGIVCNKGLAGVLEEHYRRRYVALAVLLLIIANIANIGADLGAMADSLKMLVPVNFYIATVFFALITIALEIFVGYHVYVKILKWLTISVFAYVITGFIVHPHWLAIAPEIFIPHLAFNEKYIFAMIAVFGTTITPYLFFWQASEEVEENKLGHKYFHQTRPGFFHGKIARMRTDVAAGMVLANVVFFFIVLTTAHVLNSAGITNIGTAQQAAQALRPLAGPYAYLLFAAGIIGTGLLAVPILAGSGAYALSELMKWNEGLELKFREARKFYLVIAFSILVGLSLNFFHIDSIKALYYSAYLNGLIAFPLLTVIMIVGNDRRIMGEETHPGWVKLFGWLAVVFMAVAIAATIFLAY